MIVVDAQSWRECGGEVELAVWRLLAVRRAGAIDDRYLSERTPVIDVHFAREIAEAAEEDQPRHRVELDEVAVGRPKMVDLS